jgi:ribonuclease HI
MSRRRTVSILFDGGSLGNPGKGYGSFCNYYDKQPDTIVRVDFGDGVTNNQAEYRTLISSINAALVRLRREGIEPSTACLRIGSDSKLVIEQLAGRWKVRNKELQSLHAEARRLLDQFEEVELHWLPRERVVAVLGH